MTKKNVAEDGIEPPTPLCFAHRYTAGRPFSLPCKIRLSSQTAGQIQTFKKNTNSVCF